MDFRAQVIASFDDSQIFKAFDSLEQIRWDKAELKRLLISQDLSEVNVERRESMARYIALVHARLSDARRRRRARWKAWSMKQ